MEERYPLILDGETAGELAVRREGGWTLFDVQSAPVQGIVRVSVYGAGAEGYLGVLAPEENGMGLHRRLSRSEQRCFPTKIEFAGRAGQPCAPAAETEAPEAPAEPAEEATGEIPSQPEAPEQARETEAEAAEKAEEREETEATEEAPSLEDVYWYASPDGALVCFDGEQNLIALPVGDARIPSGGGGWQKTIEGRDYVVYRTKDGRLLR